MTIETVSCNRTFLMMGPLAIAELAGD